MINKNDLKSRFDSSIILAFSKVLSTATLTIFVLCLSICIIQPTSAQDTSSVRTNTDTIHYGDSKSGYHSIPSLGGANSVNAGLKDDDKLKITWLNWNFSERTFKKYYTFKRKLHSKYRIALGTDYMFLNQYASYSYSERQATSGIFRVYGTWNAINKPGKGIGSLIVKLENRHAIGGTLTPRNLGYEAGSALSSATYKDFSWGLTNFYWKQIYENKLSFVLGIMDAGDWIDLYPMLNPYKYYLSEAYFNSPAMALPNQGLGGAVSIDNIVSNFYVAAGVQDANGDPRYFLLDNFESFFSKNEFFYWIEAGWDPSNSIVAGETIHLTYWYQDARVEAGIEESQGLCFSASKIFYKVYTGFIRAAISEGNGALMHHLIQTGISRKTIRSDWFGIGFHWGGPNDRTRRNQYGFEAFYSIQLTQHLNIMPDMQLTMNPSFNDDKDFVGVYSAVRIRYAL